MPHFRGITLVVDSKPHTAGQVVIARVSGEASMPGPLRTLLSILCVHVTIAHGQDIIDQTSGEASGPGPRRGGEKKVAAEATRLAAQLRAAAKAPTKKMTPAKAARKAKRLVKQKVSKRTRNVNRDRGLRDLTVVPRQANVYTVAPSGVDFVRNNMTLRLKPFSGNGHAFAFLSALPLTLPAIESALVEGAGANELLTDFSIYNNAAATSLKFRFERLPNDLVGGVVAAFVVPAGVEVPNSPQEMEHWWNMEFHKNKKIHETTQLNFGDKKKNSATLIIPIVHGLRQKTTINYGTLVMFVLAPLMVPQLVATSSQPGTAPAGFYAGDIVQPIVEMNFNFSQRIPVTGAITLPVRLDGAGHWDRTTGTATGATNPAVTVTPSAQSQTNADAAQNLADTSETRTGLWKVMTYNGVSIYAQLFGLICTGIQMFFDGPIAIETYPLAVAFAEAVIDTFGNWFFATKTGSSFSDDAASQSMGGAVARSQSLGPAGLPNTNGPAGGGKLIPGMVQAVFQNGSGKGNPTAPTVAAKTTPWNSDQGLAMSELFNALAPAGLTLFQLFQPYAGTSGVPNASAGSGLCEIPEMETTPMILTVAGPVLSAATPVGSVGTVPSPTRTDFIMGVDHSNVTLSRFFTAYTWDPAGNSGALDASGTVLSLTCLAASSADWQAFVASLGITSQVDVDGNILPFRLRVFLHLVGYSAVQSSADAAGDVVYVTTSDTLSNPTFTPFAGAGDGVYTMPLCWDVDIGPSAVTGLSTPTIVPLTCRGTYDSDGRRVDVSSALIGIAPVADTLLSSYWIAHVWNAYGTAPVSAPLFAPPAPASLPSTRQLEDDVLHRLTAMLRESVHSPGEHGQDVIGRTKGEATGPGPGIDPFLGDDYELCPGDGTCLRTFDAIMLHRGLDRCLPAQVSGDVYDFSSFESAFPLDLTILHALLRDANAEIFDYLANNVSDASWFEHVLMEAQAWNANLPYVRTAHEMMLANNSVPAAPYGVDYVQSFVRHEEFVQQEPIDDSSYDSSYESNESSSQYSDGVQDPSDSDLRPYYTTDEEDVESGGDDSCGQDIIGRTSGDAINPGPADHQGKDEMPSRDDDTHGQDAIGRTSGEANNPGPGDEKKDPIIKSRRPKGSAASNLPGSEGYTTSDAAEIVGFGGTVETFVGTGVVNADGFVVVGKNGKANKPASSTSKQPVRERPRRTKHRPAKRAAQQDTDAQKFGPEFAQLRKINYAQDGKIVLPNRKILAGYDTAKLDLVLKQLHSDINSDRRRRAAGGPPIQTMKMWAAAVRDILHARAPKPEPVPVSAPKTISICQGGTWVSAVGNYNELLPQLVGYDPVTKRETEPGKATPEQWRLRLCRLVANPTKKAIDATKRTAASTAAAASSLAPSALASVPKISAAQTQIAENWAKLRAAKEAVKPVTGAKAQLFRDMRSKAEKLAAQVVPKVMSSEEAHSRFPDSEGAADVLSDESRLEDGMGTVNQMIREQIAAERTAQRIAVAQGLDTLEELAATSPTAKAVVSAHAAIISTPHAGPAPDPLSRRSIKKAQRLVGRRAAVNQQPDPASKRSKRRALEREKNLLALGKPEERGAPIVNEPVDLERFFYRFPPSELPTLSQTVEFEHLPPGLLSSTGGRQLLVKHSGGRKMIPKEAVIRLIEELWDRGIFLTIYRNGQRKPFSTAEFAAYDGPAVWEVRGKVVGGMERAIDPSAPSCSSSLMLEAADSLEQLVHTMGHMRPEVMEQLAEEAEQERGMADARAERDGTLQDRYDQEYAKALTALQNGVSDTIHIENLCRYYRAAYADVDRGKNKPNQHIVCACMKTHLPNGMCRDLATVRNSVVTDSQEIHSSVLKVATIRPLNVPCFLTADPGWRNLPFDALLTWFGCFNATLSPVTRGQLGCVDLSATPLGNDESCIELQSIPESLDDMTIPGQNTVDRLSLIQTQAIDWDGPPLEFSIQTKSGQPPEVIRKWGRRQRIVIDLSILAYLRARGCQSMTLTSLISIFTRASTSMSDTYLPEPGRPTEISTDTLCFEIVHRTVLAGGIRTSLFQYLGGEDLQSRGTAGHVTLGCVESREAWRQFASSGLVPMGSILTKATCVTILPWLLFYSPLHSLFPGLALQTLGRNFAASYTEWWPALLRVMSTPSEALSTLSEVKSQSGQDSALQFLASRIGSTIPLIQLRSDNPTATSGLLGSLLGYGALVTSLSDLCVRWASLWIALKCTGQDSLATSFAYYPERLSSTLWSCLAGLAHQFTGYCVRIWDVISSCLVGIVYLIRNPRATRDAAFEAVSGLMTYFGRALAYLRSQAARLLTLLPNDWRRFAILPVILLGLLLAYYRSWVASLLSSVRAMMLRTSTTSVAEQILSLDSAPNFPELLMLEVPSSEQSLEQLPRQLPSLSSAFSGVFQALQNAGHGLRKLTWPSCPSSSSNE